MIVRALLAPVAGADHRSSKPRGRRAGDGQRGQRVQPGRVAERHQVERPRPARAPVVVPNSWPRARSSSPTSSSSSVGNGPDPTRSCRPCRCPRSRRCPSGRRRAGTRRPGDRVGRGHERIGAVVDVEHRALRPLEEDDAPGLEQVPGQLRRVGDVALELVAVGQVLLGHRVQVERRIPGVRAQRQALGLERRADLLLEDLLVEEVLHADAQAGRLVGVARADAPLGRPDLELSEAGLPGRVEKQVVGHDQVGVGRDPQPGHVDRRARRPEISSIRMPGSTTTPLPMMQRLPG